MGPRLGVYSQIWFANWPEEEKRAWEHQNKVKFSGRPAVWQMRKGVDTE